VVRKARGGAPKGALSLRLIPGREFHTLLEHRFGQSVDWSGIDHLLLSFRGSGGGTHYRIVVDFDKGHRGSRAFLFADRRPRARLVAFSTLGGRGSQRARWSHVVSVRIASDNRDTDGTLTIGQLRTVRAVERSIAMPVEPAPAARVVAIGGRKLRLAGRATTLTLAASQALLGSRRRVLVLPTAPIRARPAVPVRFTREGATTYRFSVASSRPGVLVLAQSYDPRWLARVGASTRKPVSVFGLENGYLLSAGRHAGSIAFSGQRYGQLGAGASAVSFVGLLGLGLGARRRRRLRDWDAW
jgi:hypothetical protein